MLYVRLARGSFLEAATIKTEKINFNKYSHENSLNNSEELQTSQVLIC